MQHHKDDVADNAFDPVKFVRIVVGNYQRQSRTAPDNHLNARRPLLINWLRLAPAQPQGCRSLASSRPLRNCYYPDGSVSVRR